MNTETARRLIDVLTRDIVDYGEAIEDHKQKIRELEHKMNNAKTAIPQWEAFLVEDLKK